CGDLVDVVLRARRGLRRGVGLADRDIEVVKRSARVDLQPTHDPAIPHDIVAHLRIGEGCADVLDWNEEVVRTIRAELQGGGRSAVDGDGVIRAFHHIAQIGCERLIRRIPSAGLAAVQSVSASDEEWIDAATDEARPSRRTRSWYRRAGRGN